jgi:hypothetical protein
MFFPTAARDTIVADHAIVGYTTDYLGRKIADIRAPVGGLVTFIRGVPSMWPGATLVNVSPVLATPPPTRSRLRPTAQGASLNPDCANVRRRPVVSRRAPQAENAARRLAGSTGALDPIPNARGTRLRSGVFVITAACCARLAERAAKAAIHE